MKYLQSVNPPPPPAIPPEDNFESELCGSDEENFIYIKVKDPDINLLSLKLKAQLFNDYEATPKPSINPEEIHPGLFVIIKQVSDGSKSECFRAVVLRKQGAGLVFCFKIDEGCGATVLTHHVYEITREIMKTQILALKCYLDGVDLFDALPHLMMAYKLIKMGYLDIETYYDTRILCILNGIPIIRMTRNGISLTSQIQRWIYNLCSLKVPEVGQTFRAEVVHVTWNGTVFLHPVKDNEILGRIQGTLQELNFKNIKDIEFDGNSTTGVQEFWKKKFFSIPTGIYITSYEGDGEYYRATLKRPINKEKVEVEYMDYGNSKIVPRASLISCKDIDENLAFIPSQCIKSHLVGFFSLNEKEFWKNVNGLVDVKVVDEGNSNSGLEVELYLPGSTVSLNEMMGYGATPRIYGK